MSNPSPTPLPPTVDNPPGKRWYQSKTVWLNVITAAVAIISVLIAGLGTAPGEVSPWLPWGLLIVSNALNVVLRIWFTNDAIVSGPKQ